MPTLEITTMIGCPLRCTYCPQDKLRAEYGESVDKYISLDGFKTILAKVPAFVRIDFSGMAEPWANPYATAMLAHALAEGRNVGIYTTLLGMRNPDEVVALIVAHAKQVETVVIHLPDRNGNMRGWRWSEQYGAALRAFERLNGIVHLETMTMDQWGQPHPDLLEHGFGWVSASWNGNDRAGSLDVDDLGEQPVERGERNLAALSCSFTPFYDHNVLLPNGDVVLCCMDYSIKHKIGNLILGNYHDLFASPVLTALRVENMKPDCGNSICKRCTRAQRYELPSQHRQFWKPLAA